MKEKMKENRKELKNRVDKLCHRAGTILDNNCPVLRNFNAFIAVSYAFTITCGDGLIWHEYCFI
ncbi:MAG: hypothetical protein QME69_01160 [Candidatus Saccharicenans sp.]|nr:hypothetical protein [Candidatus Saccharicenans sp.]